MQHGVMADDGNEHRSAAPPASSVVVGSVDPSRPAKHTSAPSAAPTILVDNADPTTATQTEHAAGETSPVARPPRSLRQVHGHAAREERDTPSPLSATPSHRQFREPTFMSTSTIDRYKECPQKSACWAWDVAHSVCVCVCVCHRAPHPNDQTALIVSLRLALAPSTAVLCRPITTIWRLPQRFQHTYTRTTPPGHVRTFVRAVGDSPRVNSSILSSSQPCRHLYTTREMLFELALVSCRTGVR